MIELQMPSAQSSAHFSSSSVCVGGTNHLLVLSLYNSKTQNLTKTTKILLGTTLFPGFAIIDRCSNLRGLLLPIKRFAKPPRASLLDNPAIWAGRTCVFYALLKAGLAGSPANPFLSAPSSAADLKTGGSYLGFSKLVDKFLRNPDKEAADRRKLVSKWHPTTKGTLRRNYRIPSKSEGKRLLKAIASLLSEDDHFIDATTHKGCQIRRESAHGESVCCNNVRALFDELPTPHLIVEITAFPAGPLSEKDYAKAEKLERVLRSSPSI